MEWLTASNIKVLHGFSTRHGGCSSGPFASLNLGGHEDEPEKIQQNRQAVASELGFDLARLSLLKQVHGADVIEASPGIRIGDAQVTSEPGIPLVVQVADCYPLLFHDPVSGVIGSAHAGWRGTLADIAGKTINKMVEKGAKTENIQAAIGPGISTARFEVGKEVTLAFSEAEFPDSCFRGNRINLIEANLHLMHKAGLLTEHIRVLDRCSYESDFFSYRRDHGLTGRMWGLIVL